MGGIPKKFTVLRALLLCLAVVFSLVSIAASVSLLRVANNDTSPLPNSDYGEDPDYVTKWIDLAPEYFANSDESRKIAHIQSAGELAALNRIITENNYDRKGWTFILDNDLDMAKYGSNHSDEKVKPLWTPINAVTGRNTGIIIDGNGHKISNLLIKMDDDATKDNGVEAKNGVGFFGNLVGCTIRNLTFENPVINYTYKGDSKLASDATHPTAPVNVAVGVVAGIAENAYISKVDIINPQVNVTTNNANGHSIYVGTAVGKMIYNDYNNPTGQKVSPKLQDEYHWGVDTVTVTGGKVGLTVEAGTGTNDGAYGVATNGYIGGLVGYNNSSKIINSKIKGLTVDPQMAGIAGTNHADAGGLVGYTMLRVPTLNDVVLTGLINNVIMDTTITAGQATNTGMLAGYVYDSWIYNNIYLGDDASSAVLYGAFYNQYYIIIPESECLANCDYETFIGNDYFCNVASDGKSCTPQVMNENYVFCQKHSMNFDALILPHIGEDRTNEGTYLAYANNYNYKKTKAEFATFKDGELFNKLDDFEHDGGNFYEIGTQKAKHEYRKTEVDAADIRQAVNELRVWEVVGDAENGYEPQFGDNLGYDYDVVFHANGENMNIKYDVPEAGRCNAGWVVQGDYIDTINTELVKSCKYKEPILDLLDYEMPTCVGWSFDDWYEDEQCTRKFNFGTLMGENGSKPGTINIYAAWTINSYTVEYYLADDFLYKYNVADYPAFDGVETVTYGSWVKGPQVAPDLSKYTDSRFFGKSFAGSWCTLMIREDNESDFGEPWVFGNVDDYTPMPGENIKLYAALEDEFETLRAELESAAVTDAFNNRDCYTEKSFDRFSIAYDNAEKVMEAHADQHVDQVIEELRDSLAALTVNVDYIRSLPPIANPDSDQNRYPFLYDFNSYKEYTEIKRTAVNYLNVEIATEGMLQNVERYKYIRDTLMTKYNNLAANLNPYIGMDDNLKSEVKRSYTQIMAEIDTFNPADYTAESWKDFDLRRSQFKEAFKSDYSNPHIADLKGAIDNYNSAKAQLVRGQGTTDPNKPGADSNTPKAAGGMSPIVIGVLVALAAVVGVSGYVGVDIYLNKKVRPQKEQAEKAEQAAAEDTYI